MRKTMQEHGGSGCIGSGSNFQACWELEFLCIYLCCSYLWILGKCLIKIPMLHLIMPFQIGNLHHSFSWHLVTPLVGCGAITPGYSVGVGVIMVCECVCEWYVRWFWVNSRCLFCDWTVLSFNKDDKNVDTMSEWVFAGRQSCLFS